VNVISWDIPLNTWQLAWHFALTVGWSLCGIARLRRRERMLREEICEWDCRFLLFGIRSSLALVRLIVPVGRLPFSYHRLFNRGHGKDIKERMRPWLLSYLDFRFTFNNLQTDSITRRGKHLYIFIRKAVCSRHRVCPSEAFVHTYRRNIYCLSAAGTAALNRNEW